MALRSFRRCAPNDRQLVVVLGGAGFEVEGGALDGGDLGVLVTAFVVHEAKGVPDVLAL